MSQKALFPMKYLNVTQGYGVGTHRGSFALDLAGKDSGVDNVMAPFDAVVRKVWNNGHTVWLESITKVLYADGRVDFATMSFTHDNNIANVFVGMKLKRGQVFYQEGTAGNATGNHVHAEAALGKFTGAGWHLNTYGYWTINNPYPLHRLLWLSSTTIVKKSGNYAWKKVTNKPPVLAQVTGKLGAYVRTEASTNSKIVKSIPYKYRFVFKKVVIGQRHRIGLKVTDKWIQTGKNNFVSTLVARRK